MILLPAVLWLQRWQHLWAVAGVCERLAYTVPGLLHAQGDLEPVYRAALALGTANQLTNILRDVGEDIQTRNRIYLPLQVRARGGRQGQPRGGGHPSSTAPAPTTPRRRLCCGSATGRLQAQVFDCCCLP